MQLIRQGRVAYAYTDLSRSSVSVMSDAERTVHRSSNWSLYGPLASLTIV